MLKTIKTTKYLNLCELIKYVRENKKTLFKENVTISFKTKNNNEVIFYKHGQLTLDNWISSVDLFEVEIEEEITQDTEFENLVSTYPPLGYSDDSFVDVYTNQTINRIISEDKMIGVETERIYALIEGKLELIYECDNQ